MAKFKVVGFNTTAGKQFQVLREIAGELKPTTPIKYFKTKSGAEKHKKKLMNK